MTDIGTEAPVTKERWPRAVVLLAALLAGLASLLHWAGVRTLAHDLALEVMFAVVAASALMIVALAIGAEPWRSLRAVPSLRLAHGVFLAALGVGAAVCAVSLVGVLPYPGGGEHAGHAGAAVAGVGVREWIRLVAQVLLVAVLGWLVTRSSQPAAAD